MKYLKIFSVFLGIFIKYFVNTQEIITYNKENKLYDNLNLITNTSDNILINTKINKTDIMINEKITFNITKSTQKNITNELLIDNYTIKDYFRYFKFDITDYYIIVIITYIIICVLFLGAYIITKNQQNFIIYLNQTINIREYYYSYGSIIFMFLYLIWWLGLFVYSFLIEDKIEIMARLGVWITLNLSTVFLPITRNSIWVIFFNISQERILHIHRFISTLCIISVIIKFIAVLILYPANFLIKIINPQTGGSPLFGTIATIIFLLCGIFAMNKIRQKMFELFYYSHRIFSISIIIFSSLHYISFLYYILPAIILYFIDLIIRYLYTTTSIYSKIQNIGDEDYSCSLINITIQKNIKVFPGCYFFICFYKDISRFQWHPLSMVNYENNNMVFCAKNIGKYSWTGRLHDTIKNDTNILNNKYVYIQGPYGHISVNYRENKYDNINIISGGIGITPMISIIKDISILYNTGKLSKLKKVNFVWIIKYISILKYFKKYLINYNKNIFDIKVYITNENENIENCNYSEYNYDIKIINNKPDIINLLNMEYSQYKNMVILTCGPDRMTNKILRFSNEYNIDISNEIF